jgi:hypothetical protein
MGGMTASCVICGRPLGRLADRKGRVLCGAEACRKARARQARVPLEATEHPGVRVRRGVNQTTYYVPVRLKSGRTTHRSFSDLNEAIEVARLESIGVRSDS